MAEPEIPNEELAVLVFSLVAAEEQARGGNQGGGCGTLLAGLERAREVASGDAEWGNLLVARWEEALRLFVRTHRIGEEDGD